MTEPIKIPLVEAFQREMRDLEIWLAEHAMGWKRLTEDGEEDADRTFRVHAHHYGVFRTHDGGGFDQWEPTYYREDAMELLEKCAEFLYTKDSNIELGQWLNEDTEKVEWIVSHDRCMVNPMGQASTLQLAICLFAKKLFSK